MEKSKMFCFVSVENQIVLGFWNSKVNIVNGEKPSWIFFQAVRTAPGEYVTSRGKVGKFDEKILTEKEAIAYVKSISEKPAAKKTARAAHGEFTPEMIAFGNQLLANGFDKADIKELVLKKFKPESPKKEEKPCWL